MRLRHLLLATSALLAVPASAVEYFVSTSGSDSNACTAGGSSACSTLNGAMGKAIGDGSGCGDIVTVQAGTYTGTVTIPNMSCVGNRFTLRRDPAAPVDSVIVGAITVGTSTSAPRRGYTIQNLKIQTAARPLIDFVCVNASSNDPDSITFDGISATSYGTSGGIGIFTTSNNACSNTGVSNRQILWQNLRLSNGGTIIDGVDLFRLAWPGMTIQDSTISNVGGHILYASNTANLTFTRNVVTDSLCSETTDSDACLVGYNHTNFVVSYNVFDNVSGDGVNGLDSIVNSRGTDASSTPTVTVQHNTFISRTSGLSSAKNSAVTANGSVDSFTVRDNIFIGYGGSQSGAITYFSCPGANADDHNLYYLKVAGSQDIEDFFGTCGGDNSYGTGDVRNTSPFSAGAACGFGASGCANPGTLNAANNWVPAAGSPACGAASDSSAPALGAIGARACAGGGGGGDTVAPSSISNLSVLPPSKAPQLGAVLSWTAPTDTGTGSSGSASSYVLVGKGAGPCTTASCSDVTAPTFTGSTCSASDGALLTAVLDSGGAFVTTLPAPKLAGQSDSMTVKALRPNWKYSFAICSRDAAPNESGLSNVVTIATAKVEGYGYQSTGGGFTGSTAPTVCRVSSLADSGAGSFRSCMTGSNYVGFGVGGTINLLSLIEGRNLSAYTVDGSTAPSPGITIQSDPTSFPNGLNDMLRIGQGTHAIWGWLRVQGKKVWPSGSASSQDYGFSFNTSTAGQTIQHVVMTHLTVRNVGDGAFDLWDQVQDTSLANNLIVFNQHPQTSGGDSGSARISWYRNLWAQNGERQPQIIATHADMDIRNNIHYDWSYGNSSGSYAIRICNDPDDAVSANIVSNAFLAGSSTRAIYYGNTGSCNSGTPESLPSGCSTQNNTTGAASVCGGSAMGELWVQGNYFSAGSPTSSYSTVAAERTVPAAAAVTTGTVASLCTSVLFDVGTHFPLSDETAAIAATSSALACAGGPVCGNGLREGLEACDGADLNSQTCVTQGFAGGTLACTAVTCVFDTSGCQIEAGKSATLQGLTCTGCTIQ